ncbi:MAG TPA: ECF transporter S component [Clostridiaceae bacterium]|nr:ECF transporter S component [Clostridiaceae bacterium]
MMIALVFLATYFTKIPIPATQGYFNLGDTIILVTAILLGAKSGLLVGAIGSLIADIAGGYYLFAPLTFIVKGLEGYVAGKIAFHKDCEKVEEFRKVFAVIIGAVAMASGYFIGEAYFLGLFDSTFGLTAAVAELPLNLIQGGISAVVGYVLASILEKTGVSKYIN